MLPEPERSFPHDREASLQAIARRHDGLLYSGTNLGGQAAAQPDQEEPRMRHSSAENQRPEILVLRHENALLLDGQGKHLLVGRAAGPLRDGDGIVPERLQMGSETRAEIFVDEKPQAGRLSGSGMISS